jgi:hypothetical protein
MTPQTVSVLNTVSEALHIPEDELLRKGLRAYLKQQLRAVRADIFEIYGRHQISGVAEMEGRYRDGVLDEAGTWRDFQRLDHLEYKRDYLQKLIENVLCTA